ncbi:ATP-grasp fold amidoligase family protein [Aerococcus urinaeequi]|uniref:Glycosyl transferase n=1 Tax=Aerococcus urinaeequi TaxID=51665 RepID=A0A7M1KR03_9LACT|nr:ATP-grasp fold amidoligase family protein [Aerococcus urinaeequi]QOQ78643.1 glycosyl transferase [Aerococcus urinaeequi]
MKFRKIKVLVNNSHILSKFYSSFRKKLTKISPTLNTKVTYLFSKGTSINLKNPQTLDEKISWLKLNTYSNNPLIEQCADKYKVREYIRTIGKEDILNDIYKVYDEINDIRIKDLPQSFVLKWNMGAGGNLIVHDKNRVNLEEELNKLKLWKYNWDKDKPYLSNAEMQYTNIKPKLILEKYLGNEFGDTPIDYKFYCFNGKAEYVMLCIGRETGHPKFYFMDRKWNLVRINKDGKEADHDFSLPKPTQIDLMFEYADSLSKPFPFVRTDLYLVDGKIIFGELTFTPAGGIDANLPAESDLLLGSMLKL